MWRWVRANGILLRLPLTAEIFIYLWRAGGSRAGKLDLGAVNGWVVLAPPSSPWPDGVHFGGKIAGLTILRRGLNDNEVKDTFDKAQIFRLFCLKKLRSPGPSRPSNKPGTARRRIQPACRTRKRRSPNHEGSDRFSGSSSGIQN